ncbi:MAG: hypothetical protein KAI66_26260, partial [Lentisphaeria bacterium]|nr:hypothetical protein [Lentisphaeria bacterium]
LAAEALSSQSTTAFDTSVGLIEQDVRALPDDTIGVREKWRQVKMVLRPDVIKAFDAATVAMLRMEIAPLMQWRTLDGYEDAYQLDLLVTRMQICQLKGSGKFHDLRGKLQAQVSQLPINIAQVASKAPIIQEIKNPVFWQCFVPAHAQEPQLVGEALRHYGSSPIEGDTPVGKLDHARRELRDIMHCRTRQTPPSTLPLVIDVTDTEEKTQQEVVKLEGLDLAAYRHRVEHALLNVFDSSPVLQRIKAGKPVDDQDILRLINKINAGDPTLRVDDLLIHFPNPDNRLDLAIRQIIGLDAEAVDAHFTQFVQKYPGLTSHQIRFLALIQKQVVNDGKLEIGKLYEPPFTQMHIESVDGVFTDDEQIDDLLELISKVNVLGLPA